MVIQKPNNLYFIENIIVKKKKDYLFLPRLFLSD